MRANRSANPGTEGAPAGDFPRPVVVVSKCLGFAPVRWDGRIIADSLVRRLEARVDFIPVCPEVEIGLGVPREPLQLEIRDGDCRLVQVESGLDFTDRMIEFAESFLSNTGRIDGFILKSRSPSCGIRDVKIYRDSGDSDPVGVGAGIFARAVLERFPSTVVEDENRLARASLREAFLTRIFARYEIGGQ